MDLKPTQTKTVDKRTYNVPEFAELAGISRVHAYRLVERGEIPVVRLGRRMLIPGWYVEQLLGEPKQITKE